MKADQIRKKYPQLKKLFICYFTSIWPEEYGTQEKVIVEFATHSQIDELLDILLEIDEIKKEFPNNENLKSVLEDDLCLGYGLCFEYLKMTGEQWLDFVASIIKEELNKKQKKT